MSYKLTDGDINQINYFWKEKGDLSRWCAWKEKQKDFMEACPELIKAYNDYIASVRILNAVVRSLTDNT